MTGMRGGCSRVSLGKPVLIRARHGWEICSSLGIALALLLGAAPIAEAGDVSKSRRAERERDRAEGTGGEADYRAVEAKLERARRSHAAAGADVAVDVESLLAAAVIDEILPRWLGVPWREGKGSAARRPDQPDAAVNCGSFVVAVLESAGFRVAHRNQLAQAPALRVLEAVAEEGGIARWQGTIPELERELVRQGPGLYVLGLARHIGFAVVAGGEVRLVHASRGAGQVVDEEMATSAALLRSRGAPIFAAKLLVRAAPPASAEMPAAKEDEPGQRVRPLLARWLAGAALGPR